VEKYLNKCLDTIINQTYRNLEIILVDDGSPDCCGKICDDYKFKDERVVVVHKENEGVSEARNSGLDIAKGKYIMFVDSDDYIDENMVYKLYSALYENNADMSLCGFKEVDSYGNIGEKYSYIKDRVIDGIEAITSLTSNESVSYVVPWGKLYKRELFKNIRFPAKKLHEDVLTTHKIYSKCNRIACIGVNLYFYRQHSDSICGTLKTQKIDFDGVEAYLERALFKRTITIEAKYVLYDLLTAIKKFDDIIASNKIMYVDDEKIKLLRKTLRENKCFKIYCDKKSWMKIMLLSYFPSIYIVLIRGLRNKKNIN
jgi:glycosyltransferase involved in cell wall biosynthesis